LLLLLLSPPFTLVGAFAMYWLWSMEDVVPEYS
jgi:hypothetical protein